MPRKTITAGNVLVADSEEELQEMLLAKAGVSRHLEQAPSPPRSQTPTPKPRPEGDEPDPEDEDEDDFPDPEDTPDPANPTPLPESPANPLITPDPDETNIPEEEDNPKVARVPDTGQPYVSPDATHNPVLTYRSRIAIVDAWQYRGSLAQAPQYINRIWASYADYDPQTKTPAGPALRVQTGGIPEEKIARSGDYIVRQRVTLIDGVDEDITLDVWKRDEFERLYLPVRQPVTTDELPDLPEEPAVKEPR